ncbi:MAG: mechanosensitive ion channel [Bythopirellula sp.]|nr:mechanosensitive ion channel [Bythopirellula sp.]
MNIALFAQAVAPRPISEIRAQALELARTLNFSAMDREHWIALGEYYGLRAMFVVVLMILAWTISSWLSSIVQKGLSRIKFDTTLTLFLARLVRWGILFLTALTCLSYFGVETTSFAAIIGAAGLAIGLAFQGTLSNFAAGAMLLIFRPYKVGDTITSGNYQGTVAEIALFTTEIDTSDGRRIIIPNSAINGSVIENVTYHRLRQVAVPVGVAYDADIDITRKALERALTMVPQAVRDPLADVVLLGLGDSAVSWTARVWATQADNSTAKQALIRAVKIELDQAGIGIPFPQMDVHLIQTGNQQAA